MDETPLRTHYDSATHTLVLSGMIDETTVDELRQELHGALAADQARPLAVDLNDVSFLPSLAIGVLVGVRRRGHRVLLRAEDGTLAHRVLAMTGLASDPHLQVS